MQEEPFFPVEEGFVFIDNIPLEDRVRGQLPPTKKEECEVGSFQDFTIEIWVFVYIIFLTAVKLQRKLWLVTETMSLRGQYGMLMQ